MVRIDEGDVGTDRELSQQNRANIVTARESARLAADGYDEVDFTRVIGMLDAVLAFTCPHDPTQYTQGRGGPRA